MADKTFTKGDTVFDIDGHQGEYLMAYEDAHLVLPHFREDADDWSGSPWSGEPTVWHEVFEKPPVPVVHEEVAAARAELEQLELQVAEREGQLRELQQGDRDRLTRLKEHRLLARIDDWLAGRITHFVTWSRYSDEVKVETFDAVMLSEKERRAMYGRGVPLLVLYGSLETDHEIHRTGIEWFRVSEGDLLRLIPCSSEEDARAIAIKAVGHQVEAWRKNHAGRRPNAETWRYENSSDRLAASLTSLGLDVPEDLAAWRAECASAGAAERLAVARKAAAESQQKVLEAEAAARAAGIEITPAAAAA